MSQQTADTNLLFSEQLDSPRAWVTVAAGFLSCFTLFGVAYSFGAFFKPMEVEFGATHEATSAIFSITACIYFLLGPLTGYLTDRFGPRPVVIVGALGMGTGLILTSFIPRLWFAYLTYGLGVGIGVSCCYVPLLAVVAGWFYRRRNTALGVAVAGIGAGTLTVPPIAGELIVHIGWRHAYAVFGIAVTVLLMVCAILSRRPPVAIQRVARQRIGEFIRDRNFIVLYIASALANIATAIPFIFLPVYARDQGMTEVAAASLISFVGLTSMIGRVGLGTIADRTGLIRLYQGAVLALGLSYLIWLAAGSSYVTMVLFALAVGATYGGYVALTPAVLAELFGVSGMGVVLGTLYTSTAVTTLVGPPIVGAVIDHTGSYSLGILLTIGTTITGFLLLLALRPTKESVEAGAMRRAAAGAD